MTDRELHEIETVIGYTFRNPTLLRQAFTRRSYTHEMGQSKTPSDTDSNEVLEFIGDSVLSAALVTILAGRYAAMGVRGLESRFSEGELSIIKSNLSDKRALSELVTRLGLARYMRVSRGDLASGIADCDSPKEDLFESIVGAVALDCDMDFSVIVPLVGRLDRPDRLTCRPSPEKDAKSTLKELCEKRGVPYAFELTGESGPDHNRTYTVLCRVDGTPMESGTGRSVKRAEMDAAARTLGKMK